MPHRLCPLCLLVAAIAPTSLLGQATGTVRGKVTIQSTGDPLHHATVLLVQAGRRVETSEDGTFVIPNVSPGTYDVLAQMRALSDTTRRVQVRAGDTTQVDFQLAIQPLRQEVTVTATGQETTTFEALQTVTSVPGYEITTRAASNSLGELLEQEAGIAKRSFGPGTARPVVRGFDGDRVLVLQDGMRTGTLSSQSGDHGEPVDPLSLERIEVIRGPATLLYGSNAIGGVVNVITDQTRSEGQNEQGLHGQVTASAGTTNSQAGGSGNFHYSRGGLTLRGGGGGFRTGDYDTPIGRIENSGTYSRNGSLGLTTHGSKGFLSLNFQAQDGKYGVPFAAFFEGEPESEIDLDWRRYNTRLNGALRALPGFAEDVNFYVNYSDWNHQELEEGEVGTTFFNKQLTYQATARQKRTGPFSGSFGFWGLQRDFETIGEEALAPPVDQNAFALFGLEEVSLERVRLQFGGRYERNRYTAVDRRERTFNGLSGSAGVLVPLGRGTSAVANFTHSYRAPALEELYNFGPHLGTLTFEVGNENLRGERGNGIEASLRHQSGRFRAEANAFYYRFRNFVYLAPTGAIEDGLVEADYAQASTRYMGAEAKASVGLRPSLWLNLGFDVVDAQIRGSRTPLPRIPPVRGRISADYRRGGFLLRPELVLSNAQGQVFPTETRTPGFAVVNLLGGHTWVRSHTMHTVSANFFNAGDRLYRNHLSFIKDFAPEIGRGLRVSYTLNFY